MSSSELSEYSGDEMVDEYEMDENENPIIPDSKKIKGKAIGGKD